MERCMIAHLIDEQPEDNGRALVGLSYADGSDEDLNIESFVEFYPTKFGPAQGFAQEFVDWFNEKHAGFPA